MKKEILMLAVLMMSAACTEISVPDKVNSGEYRTLYFTSEKPVSGDETKTYYDPVSNGILWESGDKIIVALSNSAELEQDTYTGVDVPSRVWGNAYLYSAPAAISDEGKTAKFALTETEPCPFPTTSGKYRFHALYPFSALFAYGNVSIWDWGVSVGTTADNKGQYPTATSYDPNMDIMLGISQKEYDGINSKITDGEDIPMVFDRLVTHGKITVTNIPNEMTNITKAVITSPEGCTMSGIYYINVLGKEFGGDDKANLNYVILNYDSSGSKDDGVKSTVPLGQVVDGQFDLWFCTKPIEIAEGEPLTISLYNESGCLSRTIKANSNGIKFEKNKLSTLTVSMKDMFYSEYSYQLLKEPGGEPLEDNL